MEDRKSLITAGLLLMLFLFGAAVVVLTLQASPTAVRETYAPSSRTVYNFESRVRSLEQRNTSLQRQLDKERSWRQTLETQNQQLGRELERLRGEMRVLRATSPRVDPPQQVPYGEIRTPTITPPVSAPPVTEPQPPAPAPVSGGTQRFTITSIIGNVRFKDAGGTWWQLEAGADFPFGPGSCLAVNAGARITYRMNGHSEENTLAGQTLLRGPGPSLDCKAEWSYPLDRRLNGRIEDAGSAAD